MNFATPNPRLDRWQDNLLFLGLLSVLPLLGAQFGSGNQIEQFAQIARVLNPDAMPGDLYVDGDTGFSPRFYYVHLMAWLASLTSLPIAVHTLSLISNFMLVAVTFAAAVRFMGANRLGAALAAVLVLTNGGISIGLAGYLHFDSFQPASLAIPLGLIGIYFALQWHPAYALAAFAPAILMHPLVGTEMAAIGYGAAFATVVLRRRSLTELVRRAGPTAIAGAAMLAIVAAFWILPTAGTSAETPLTDEELFGILAQFRAPHHYIGSQFWPKQWLFAGIFVAGVAVAYGIRIRVHGWQPTTVALMLSSLIVITICLASLYFVDILHDRMFVTAQVFRMVMVLKWASYLVVAWLLARWMQEGEWHEGVLALAVVAANENAVAYVLAIVLAAKVAIGIIRRLKLKQLGTFAIWGVLVLVAVVTAFHTQRYGVHDHTVRALIGFALAMLLMRQQTVSSAGAVIAIVLVAAVLTATTITRHQGLLGWHVLKAELVWADQTDTAADAARQAENVSPPDALWLVPPDMERFRVMAKRAVVVDFTAIPFDQTAMAEWRSRMETLFSPGEATGFAALRAMTENYRAGIDWSVPVTKYRASHAVLFTETPWDGPTLYQNEDYKLVALPGG